MDSTNDRQPLSEQLADRLRAEITSGQLQPGDKLPPEQEIADERKVSRGTVRQALAILTSEGLVAAGRGRGRHVRRYNPIIWEPGTFEHQTHRGDRDGTGQDAWTANVAAQGRAGRQEIDPGFTQAPEVVAEGLGVERLTTVAVRRRLRLIDGTPFQTADSYYPRDIAEGTPIMEPGDVTIPGGMMASVGHQQVRFRDRIWSRPPTKDEATRLLIPSGTSVFQHVRTGYDEDGRAVRVIVTIAPGDRHIIVYDVSAT